VNGEGTYRIDLLSLSLKGAKKKGTRKASRSKKKTGNDADTGK
jgi:hypothetical protein